MQQRKEFETESFEDSKILNNYSNVVAALGTLRPEGDIRVLAAPSGGVMNSPRVQRLLVSEGDVIKKGQILAFFDNRDTLMIDLEKTELLLQSLKKEINLKSIEVERYINAANLAASSKALAEQKEINLLQLKRLYTQVIYEQKSLQEKFKKSQLESPLDGVVLKINALEGERPSENGVIEVGAIQSMQAVIEVYESDISRVYIGQLVNITSENGGFKSNLAGEVTLISPQISQREVISTDPTGDVDARIVEVEVTLREDDSLKVSKYTGMKVIARFTN